MARPLRATLALTLLLALAACGTSGHSVLKEPYESPSSASTGIASWYGPGFHGRQTASGERFDQNALTAAHRSLAFGTRVRVTNLSNGRSVVVTINDRGPFVGGRIIDLSKQAAAKIGMVRQGTAKVRVEVVGRVASS